MTTIHREGSVATPLGRRDKQSRRLIAAAAIVLGLALPASAQEEAFIVGDATRFHELVPRDANLETISSEFKSTEGPLWIGGDDGFLVFTASHQELKKWSPTGGLATFRKPTNATNGSALDPQGRLVSCEQAARRVTRVAAEGTICTSPRPSNVAFGGPGRRTLFITAKEKLYKINLDAAGARSPAGTEE